MQINASAVLVHCIPHHGQPQPGAAAPHGFTGVERLKNSQLIGFSDAGARIGNTDHNVFTGFNGVITRNSILKAAIGSGNGNSTPFLNSLHGVHDKIDKRFSDMHRRSFNGLHHFLRSIYYRYKRMIFQGSQSFRGLQAICNQRIEFNTLKIVGRATGNGQQILHHRRGPVPGIPYNLKARFTSGESS